jgi:hypothetical protein
MLGGCDHVVAKTNVERCFELVDVFRQPREASPVNPRDDVQARENTQVVRGLKDSHS